MNFVIKESQIEYIYPELGMASITDVSISSDTIFITTNLPAPWTVMRMQKGTPITVSWGPTKTGPFEQECEIMGSTDRVFPGWE